MHSYTHRYDQKLNIQDNVTTNDSSYGSKNIIASFIYLLATYLNYDFDAVTGSAYL